MARLADRVCAMGGGARMGACVCVCACHGAWDGEEGSWGHGRDGDSVVVNVGHGVGGFVVDRAVAHFGDRVRGKSGAVVAVDGPGSLAGTVYVGHEIERGLCWGLRLVLGLTERHSERRTACVVVVCG